MSWVVWPETVAKLPREGHLVIEASAGTGKTFTLEHLVLRELVNGVSIERMVVVTFTEKATEELRGRVRHLIESVLSAGPLPLEPGYEQLDPVQLRRLETALSRFDRAPIATFHAFCQRVLSDHSFSGGRFLREGLVNKDRLHADAFRYALSHTFARDPELKAYLDQGQNLDALAQMLKKLHRVPKERISPPGDDVYRAFLPIYRDALTTVKRRLSAFDFDDLIDGVDAALSDPETGPALVKSLRDRYDLALIDEFQDTDEVQWAIFRRVFGEPPQRLVVIGDPKQAIYAFRGADVRTYQRAAKELLEGESPVRLRVCYRATAPLVAEYNAFLAEGILPRDMYPEPVEAKPDAHVLDDPDQPRAVVLVSVPGVRAAEMRQNLGHWMAGEIKRLVRDAKLDGKPIAYGDIFVLSYSEADARNAGEMLRSEGVPIAFFKPEGLFQTAEATAWRDVLAAVKSPNDNSAVRSALHSPFFEVPLAHLTDLDDTGRAIGSSLITQWSRLASAREYGQLFSRILDDSGVMVRSAFDGQSEREVTNLLHLAEIMLEETERQRPSIDALLAWLDRARDGTDGPSGRHGNVQRLEGDSSAVQLMTIHKSKGLEATVVFVFGGFFAGAGFPPPFAYRVDDQRFHHLKKMLDTDKETKQRIQTEDDEEVGRLSYVAITRARARVYVPFRETRETKSRPGRHGKLDTRAAAVSQLGVPVVSAGKAPDAIERLRAAAAVRWKPDPALLAQPRSPIDFEHIAKSRAGREITSYTRMKSLADTALVNDATLEVELVLGEPPMPAPIELAAGELPPGPDTGVFLHQLLEKVPLEDIGPLDAWRKRPDVASVFDVAMTEHRIDAIYREQSEQLVHAALTMPLTLGGSRLDGVARARRVVREMEFLFPWPNEYVKGYLDVVMQHGDHTWIVDWKSDRLPSYDARAIDEQVNARYKIQVQLYALALERILGPERKLQFGGIVYLFLRGLEKGQGVYIERPSPAELASWARDLTSPGKERPRQTSLAFIGEDFEPKRTRGRRK